MVLDPAWPALFSLCLTVAPGCGVLLHRCDAATAATIAAERRPLAIILSNGVYATDPAEFEALARDVRSTLVRLDEEVCERELEAMLNGALRDTREMSAQRERERERERDAGRRDEGSGRYTLIGAQRSETVGAKGAAGVDPRAAQRQGPGADPRLAHRRGDTAASQSTMPPPSSRAGSPPSARTPLTSHTLTPVPPSGGPPSFRAPPSVRTAQPSPYAAPGVPRSVPPPSTRALPGFPSVQPTASAPLSTPPPSVRGAPARGILSTPPPSMRAHPSAPPPPPSSRLPGGVPASSRALPATAASSHRPTPMPPPSSQAGPPSSTRLPSPPSLRSMANAPPSMRSVPPGAPSGIEGPPSIRTMAPLSARLAPPSSVRPELSPRSGVRERGSEELDAVFEDQNLPFDALARASRGSSTPR
ncbi:hypothetical protein [Sorangium cellulosum]|uniref:Uncharacterized protein n=1 Tax=Sorangium cellulosum TaxID=56 RepID=A0A150QZH6_SORCE|nr:hypothetical protein [Sorangium cellulosum]KYF73374.1 hypothetical protein BE15_44960 [Sorangium cellulosum]